MHSTTLEELAQENHTLREQVRQLAEQADSKQRATEQFKQFELQLLAQCTLYGFLHKILVGAKNQFSLDTISISFIDPDEEIQKLLNGSDVKDFGNHLKFTKDYKTITALFEQHPQVIQTRLTEDQAKLTFEGNSSLRSGLLIPIMNQNTIIALIKIGSCNADRFSPDNSTKSATESTAESATNFIPHLATVLAICLENCIKQEQLTRLSLIDTLTRARNRRGFDIDLSKEHSRSCRSGEPLSCLFVDADFFKRVNDTYGHQVGDQALKHIANTIVDQLRQTDHLARYGGEEFTVLLPECDQHQARLIAERIRMGAEENAMMLDCGEIIPITLSIGVATLDPKQQRTTSLAGDALVLAADQASYQAKREGRNRVCCNELSTSTALDLEAA